jgi:neutral ceramidase
MWSQFANHGTVNKYTFGYYNADHHGSATRVTEAALRRAGGAPATQDVVNAYGNSDEGDMTAGIAHSGPADADWVGRQEADAMLAAWRAAGTSMTDRPQLDERWTRTCFCGQLVTGGAVDSQPVFGVPQLTGSEEGRGPLYDNTHVPFEGVTSPTEDPVQGDKVPTARPPALNVPRAMPMMILRIGDRLVVSIPGEMTVGMGERVRAAVLSASGAAGVGRVVIAGLANEYVSYFTTPEEYERQHYEGGSTLYGRYSSNLLAETLVDMTRRLVAGEPAPDPYSYDPTNDVSATAPPFDTGASSASATSQPRATPRLGHAELDWTGGPRGSDRPVGLPFITIRRQVGGSWQTAADDLGLEVLWSVDGSGDYQARWEVPLDAPAGTYELVISANHYRLQSAPFTVAPSAALSVARAAAPAGGGLTVTLDYPTAAYEHDYTYRPRSASGGRLRATVNGRTVTVAGRAGAFLIPATPGDSVSVAAGAAQDDYGNTNATAFSATA